MNRPKISDHVANQSFDIIRLGHVRGDADGIAAGFPDIGHRLIELALPARIERHASAFVDERLRDRFADALLAPVTNTTFPLRPVPLHPSFCPDRARSRSNPAKQYNRQL